MLCAFGRIRPHAAFGRDVELSEHQRRRILFDEVQRVFSNVNVVQQLVDMIETQRAYEVSSKTITSVDEMMRYIAQNL